MTWSCLVRMQTMLFLRKSFSVFIFFVVVWTWISNFYSSCHSFSFCAGGVFFFFFFLFVGFVVRISFPSWLDNIDGGRCPGGVIEGCPSLDDVLRRRSVSYLLARTSLPPTAKTGIYGGILRTPARLRFRLRRARSAGKSFKICSRGHREFRDSISQRPCLALSGSGCSLNRAG